MRRSHRKPANNTFTHALSDAEQYRDDRLDTERQRLDRRLSWAVQRGDATSVKQLEHRLDHLADEALTDIKLGENARTP